MRQSYSEAAYWYGRAAQAGSRSAQFSYGQFLETGTGLVKDEAAAARWTRKPPCRGPPAAPSTSPANLAPDTACSNDRPPPTACLLPPSTFVARAPSPPPATPTPPPLARRGQGPTARRPH